MNVKNVEIYVSPEGSDANDGTFEHPLATVTAAKSRVRRYKSKNTQVSVIFRGGNYILTDNVVFGSDDGGYPNARVTYKAYEGERPVFIGGVKLDNSKMKPVTDEEFLSRLIDKEAIGKIYCIEIPELADYLAPIDVSDGWNALNIEVFENEKPMNSARFPKRDLSNSAVFGNYTRIVKYHKEGNELRAYFCDEALDRIKLWSDFGKREVMIDSFLAVDNWHQDYVKIEGFNLNEGYAVLGDRITYQPKLDAEVSKRTYFYNVPDELSQPGEYYIDRDKYILYFVPSNPIEEEEIYINTLSGAMFTLCQRVHFVNFEGLTFKYARGDFFEAADVRDVLFKDLEMAHGSKRAIKLRLCLNIEVRGCHIYDMGCGGIQTQFYGEQNTALRRKMSNLTVEDCDIHDVSRVARCYSAAIAADYDSCNVTIRNNKLHSSPHLLIYIRSANDILIENNEIYDAVRDTDDAGAVYWGRSSTHLGTVIRNNYFHDCGNDWATWGINCIYMDDGAVGGDIYNNVFANVTGPAEYAASTVLKAHPQSFAHFHNNIFVGSNMIYEFGGWHKGHSKGMSEFYPNVLGAKNSGKVDGGNRFEELAQWGFFSNYWREKYKDTIWARMWEVISTERISAVMAYKKELETQGAASDIIEKRTTLFVDNLTWNHKLPDGSTYDGEYWDYVKTELKEYYDEAMESVLGKSEAEILDRMISLTIENYWYNRLVPDSEIYIYDNVAVGLLPKYLDENGKMDMGVERAESEYIITADKYDSSKIFADAENGDYTLTQEALADISEKMPSFKPFNMNEIGIKNNVEKKK